MAGKNIKQMDMTVGNPLKLLVIFAIPIFLGNAFQIMYNMIDSMIAGKFIGPEALAAVGTCNSPYMFFVNLNMGVATGVGIIASQYFGAKREKEIMPLIVNALSIITLSSFVISAAGILLTPSILHLMGVPEEVFNDSATYMRIMFLSMLGLGYYNMVAGILRALGDSRTPLYFLILSSVVNTILDVTFVTVLKLGVFGIALATMIGQYISATASFLYARKKFEYFKFSGKDIRLNGQLIKKILKAGIPLGLQSATIALSNVFLQSFVNSFGPTVMAANTVAGRWDSMDNMPLNSLSMAMATYIGQNIGAKKMDRVYKAYRMFWIFAVCFCIFQFGAGRLLARPFMSMFSNDATVIEYGVKAIHIYTCFVIFLANIYINRAVINGSGDTTYAMFGGFMEVVGRLGFVSLFVLVFKIGMTGLWYAVCANWFITGFFFLFRFISGAWKKKSFV